MKQGELIIDMLQDPGKFGRDLRIGMRRSDGSIAVAEPLVFKDIEEGATATACLSMAAADVQQWMDSLWRSGFRPTEDGTTGQLGATVQHLEDMRQIAFAKIDVEKPQKRTSS